MHQHVGRLDADADDTGQQADHGMWSFRGRIFQPFDAGDLDRLDLVHDDAQPRQIASELGQSVWRERDTLRRAQRAQPLSRLAQPSCYIFV